MQTFQVSALDPAHVEAAARRFADGDPFVREVVVDAAIGYPCRVTLAWASPGDRIMLFRHRPFGAVSPYAEEGPVFARLGAQPAALKAGEIPAYLGVIPHIAVRGYDLTVSIAHAEIVAGSACADAVARAFDNDAVRFVHVRAGAHGCFQFRIDRVGAV